MTVRLMRVDSGQEQNVLFSGQRGDRITSAESLPMSNGVGRSCSGSVCHGVLGVKGGAALAAGGRLCPLSPALRHALWDPGNVALTQKENLVQYSLFDAYTARSDAAIASSLFVRDPAGAFVPAHDKHILDAARQVADRVLPSRKDLSHPELVKQFFALKLNSTLEHEVFAMALLDGQFRLIDYSEPFRGTLTQTSVYPREVIKMALAANAAAVIIGHNHPSGQLEPSQADLALTRHLKQALSMVDIRLLDHILVAANKTLSFADRGQL